MAEPGYAETGGWTRLHPLSLLRGLSRFAAAIIGVFAFDFLAFDGAPLWLEPLFAVGALGTAVVQYLRTEYRVTEEVVELRQGLLFRSLRTTRRDRVQNVTIGAGLLARAGSVAEVQISAGDSEEISLAYLQVDRARALRQRLLATGRGAAADVATAGQPQPALPPPAPPVGGLQGSVPPPLAVPPMAPAGPAPALTLATLAPADVLIYAFTGSGALAVLAAIAAAIALVTGGLGAGLPFAIGAATFLAQSDLFDFTSTVDGQRLHVTKGLFRKEEGSAPLGRVQLVEVARPPLRRVIGRETLSVRTADASSGEQRSIDVRLVAPLAPTGSWSAMTATLLARAAASPMAGAADPGPQLLPLPGEADLRRVSPVTKRITIVRGALAVVLVTTAAAVVATLLSGAVTAVVVAPLVLMGGATAIWLYADARYRQLGYAMTDAYLLIRSGVVWQRLQVIPLAKVQSATVEASILRRRLGVASVLVDVAGKESAFPTVIVDLPQAEAASLAGRLVDTAARVALPDGV